MNMKHLDHIDTIARSDTDVLRAKEATYQGSWKRAGGRSAWFMMRRNMDRLLAMMAPPPPHENFRLQNVRDLADSVDRAPFGGGRMDVEINSSVHNYATDLRYLCDSHVSEDIFAKIEERPGGEDGTVLACLRDLRRYLMLIESEMLARGVVQAEKVAGEHAAKSPSLDPLPLTGSKCRVPPLTEGKVRKGGRNHGPSQIKVRPDPPARITVSGPGTPEDGGHHEIDAASVVTFEYPWFIDRATFDVMNQRVQDDLLMHQFYVIRARDVYKLEPVVRTSLLPRELRGIYEYVGTPNETVWVLKMDKVPVGIREEFISLQREMNVKEFDESDNDFKFMYEFSSSANKYLLTEKYRDWGRIN